MSTGPHLHYEVIVNGKKLIHKIKITFRKNFKGKERELLNRKLNRLKTFRNKIKIQFYFNLKFALHPYLLVPSLS